MPHLRARPGETAAAFAERFLCALYPTYRPRGRANWRYELRAACSWFIAAGICQAAVVLLAPSAGRRWAAAVSAKIALDMYRLVRTGDAPH